MYRVHGRAWTELFRTETEPVSNDLLSCFESVRSTTQTHATLVSNIDTFYNSIHDFNSMYVPNHVTNMQIILLTTNKTTFSLHSNWTIVLKNVPQTTIKSIKFEPVLTSTNSIYQVLLMQKTEHD